MQGKRVRSRARGTSAADAGRPWPRRAASEKARYVKFETAAWTSDGDAVFVDDLTLRETEGGRRNPKEAQADQWAEEALVPNAIWQTSEARRHPTPMAVVSLSRALQVHPAIVADKIRHEQKNYRLLSHFVGTGDVRRHFGLTSWQ